MPNNNYSTRVKIIVGATSAIAAQCMRLWTTQAAEQGQTLDLSLLGRNLNKLEQIAADLMVRNPSLTTRCMALNCLDPTAIQETVNALITKLPAPIETVLIAQGYLPDQASCQSDLFLCQKTMQVNAVSPVLWAEAWLNQLEKQAPTHIKGFVTQLAIIGSVAGDRIRRTNYTYGSCKRFLEAYTQGLRHRLARTDLNKRIRIVLIKPGPTETPMTAQLTQPIPAHRLAPVETVATCIVRGLAGKKNVIYAPKKWAYIMKVFQCIPTWLFNHISV